MSSKLGNKYPTYGMSLIFKMVHGGGHLGKWQHTSGFAFLEFGMFILVCVPNFIKIK
jgi:hypothetical protein